jgi:hypothetical protein
MSHFNRSEGLKGAPGLTLLPVELIESIAELIDDADLCALRLVCKTYDDLMIRIVSRPMQQAHLIGIRYVNLVESY